MGNISQWNHLWLLQTNNRVLISLQLRKKRKVLHVRLVSPTAFDLSGFWFLADLFLQCITLHSTPVTRMIRVTLILSSLHPSVLQRLSTTGRQKTAEVFLPATFSRPFLKIWCSSIRDWISNIIHPMCSGLFPASLPIWTLGICPHPDQLPHLCRLFKSYREGISCSGGLK